MGARRGKGEGSVYKDAQGRWVAAVPLPPDPATGRRRRKVFRTRSKVEALRKMRETQNELARAGNVSTNRPVTVAEWMEQWIDQDVAPIRHNSRLPLPHPHTHHPKHRSLPDRPPFLQRHPNPPPLHLSVRQIFLHRRQSPPSPARRARGCRA